MRLPTTTFPATRAGQIKLLLGVGVPSTIAGTQGLEKLVAVCRQLQSGGGPLAARALEALVAGVMFRPNRPGPRLFGSAAPALSGDTICPATVGVSDSVSVAPFGSDGGLLMLAPPGGRAGRRKRNVVIRPDRKKQGEPLDGQANAKLWLELAECYMTRDHRTNETFIRLPPGWTWRDVMAVRLGIEMEKCVTQSGMKESGFLEKHGIDHDLYRSVLEEDLAPEPENDDFFEKLATALDLPEVVVFLRLRPQLWQVVDVRQSGS